MLQTGRKGVENTAGKGEIARYEQFLLFPQCFQKSCTADTYKPGLVWEMVKDSIEKKIARSNAGVKMHLVHSI